MDYRQRISLNPLVRSGKPCIRGTRIAVADVESRLFRFLVTVAAMPPASGGLQ